MFSMAMEPCLPEAPPRYARGRSAVALIPSPAALLPPVLLVEPGLQGGEVVEDGRGVHPLAAGYHFERLRPGAAQPHFEHPCEGLPRRLVAVDRAAVQGAGLARHPAQPAV